MQRHADGQGVTLDLLTPEEPVVISGDLDRMQQAISNLLSNSLKFTPAGGAIELRLRREGTQAHVDVRDNGIGVPPAFLPLMFQPFTQADRSTTREFGGLGLGLDITALRPVAGGRTGLAILDATDANWIFISMVPPVVSFRDKPKTIFLVALEESAFDL